MMKKIITFMTVLSLLVIQSCRSSEDEKMDNYREELQKKSEVVRKEGFRNLTTENKVRIWQSKLTQILKQDVNNDQKELILVLRTEIGKATSPDYDGIKLIETGIKLAEITPENEFINMVSSLEDYKRNDKEYASKINNDFIVRDLQIFLVKVKKRNRLVVEESHINNTLNKKPSCNCSWTCGMYSGHTDNCTPTDGGCRFFGYGDCTGVII